MASEYRGRGMIGGVGHHMLGGAGYHVIGGAGHHMLTHVDKTHKQQIIQN